MKTANVPIKIHSQTIMLHWGNISQTPQVKSASMRAYIISLGLHVLQQWATLCKAEQTVH